MAMEAIKGAGMTYQGSVSTAETQTENLPRVESAENAAAAESIAQATTAMDTKAAGDENENTSQQNQDPYNAQIRKAVEEVNKKAVNSEAIFGIHEATNRVTIKIIDKDTRKVIKEIPPEKTLDMIAKVWELAGLMVDEKR
ncbi:MAG: flagellar protein FlaG [Agathobacter sp.]|nr:flagellar protein FlaG [Agathobacter sp.]